MIKKVILRKLLHSDWEDVSKIYSEGLETGNSTFETSVPNWDDWNKTHLKECRNVAETNGKVVGWSALSPVSSRCVYGGVAEVSVYVSPVFKGQKIGTKLLEQLIEDSEDIGIWTLQAGIFPENKASLKIHERLNFREVGFREKIGKLNGVWRDIVLMERRSEITGIE